MHYELTNTNVVGNAILRRYFQYLRLERSYTPNTLDAYLPVPCRAWVYSHDPWHAS